jgi:indolepyruvate ferredoxin oxidoreductase
MAIKDEYEIARLYSSPSFKAQLEDTFTDFRTLRVHLAPPLLSKAVSNRQEPSKMAFGSWIFYLFPTLASFKFLRGTKLDLFGMTEERKRERQWRDTYQSLIGYVLEHVTPSRVAKAAELLAVPLEIKGFGHVREKAMEHAAEKIILLKKEFIEISPDFTTSPSTENMRLSEPV